MPRFRGPPRPSSMGSILPLAAGSICYHPSIPTHQGLLVSGAIRTPCGPHSMPRRKLTDRFIRTVQVKERTDFVDAGFPDFGLRVTPAGTKTFWLRYRLHGQRRRVKLGRYPRLKLAEARKNAGEMMRAVWRGEDPASVQSGATFAELADAYLEHYADPTKAPRAAAEDRRVVERELLPRWGNRPADSIHRRDVAKMLDQIVSRGSPQAAVRIRQQVSKMFNWGIEREMVEVNPCHGLSPPAKPSRRDRVLTEGELRAVWQSLDRALTMQREIATKLRAITLQRGLEVFSLRLADIDGQWWTIPAEHSKNRKPHRVWLAEAAVELVEFLRPHAKWGYLFPSPYKAKHPIRAHSGQALVKIRKASGVEDFRPHDLRRTGATMMTGKLSIPRFNVGRVLNHTEAGVTRIYDRYAYDREKREALERWSTLLHQIVE